MASNPYVNKVVYGDTVLLDLTQTTAEAADVASGKVFVSASGAVTIGTGEGETLTILKYGISTWAEFLEAYQKNAIVYCRAASGSDPAAGSQSRMAFLAYVNNETNPTEAEFQYYRSVSTHSDSQQGDQVFIYKRTPTDGWTVTIRSAFSKIVAGTGLTSSYSNGVLTLSLSS